MTAASFAAMNLAMAASTTPVTVSYTAEARQEPASSSFNFATQAIGIAAANRHVVVGISTRATVTVSTVTIGGVSASSVVAINAGGTQVSMWIAAVPTGTTATVAVTTSGSCARCFLGVWAMYGSSGTASDTFSTATGDPLAATGFDVQANGVAIGYMFDNNNSTATWTNLTERFDQGDGSNAFHTGASNEFSTAQTGLAVSVNEAAANNVPGFVLAAFPPGPSGGGGGGPDPIVGSGTWTDQNVSGENYVEYATADEIEYGVYVAHQYGGDRNSIKSWGVEGVSGVVVCGGDFGGADQVNTNNWEKVKRVIDDVKSRYAISKFMVLGVSGGGRMAMGIPAIYPGAVQASISQLGIYDVAYFYNDSVARGDSGTAAQIASDCGGTPPNSYSDQCSPKFYVDDFENCHVWVDSCTGDTVVQPYQQSEFVTDVTGNTGVTVVEYRTRGGNHVPDYTWLKDKITEAKALI